MHKAKHKELNPISLRLFTLFGYLTTASTCSSPQALTQSAGSSENHMQALEVGYEF
jgi:hypothetical protein